MEAVQVLASRPLGSHAFKPSIVAVLVNAVGTSPDHCGLAREGGFHDAEHRLIVVNIGSRHAARNRHYQRHAKADRRGW